MAGGANDDVQFRNVIPAEFHSEEELRNELKLLDSRFRGNDKRELT